MNEQKHPIDTHDEHSTLRAIGYTREWMAANPHGDLYPYQIGTAVHEGYPVPLDYAMGAVQELQEAGEITTPTVRGRESLAVQHLTDVATMMALEDRHMVRGLVDRRKSSGLSVEAVSERMGVPVSEVAEMERYDSDPTLGQLRAYKLALLGGKGR